eukprot:10138778-Alexandrium_andersonii.AAC.1
MSRTTALPARAERALEGHTRQECTTLAGRVSGRWSWLGGARGEGNCKSRQQVGQMLVLAQ